MKNTKRYFDSVKDYEMEVFGEKYDLSKCTPKERVEVEKWYEKNKDEKVPVVGDSPSNHVDSEVDRRVNIKPSSALDCELALESLKGGSAFNPDLKGKPKHIELYRTVHPLGGNLSLEDAAKQFGTNRVTAWRWLKRLKTLNPDAFDLDKWPTKQQCDVYRLIHPDLGGLTYREAAKALESTYQHVVAMMARMRQTHPAAFVFEHLPRPEVVRYDPNVHDETVTQKF